MSEHVDITSHQNPLVKRIRSLKSRKARQREGVCWVEGILAVREAIETGWPIETIVRAPELLTSASAEAAVGAADAPSVTVSRAVFERLSDRDGPRGLGAIVETRTVPLGALELDAESLVIALENPQDPGNIGSILRTGSAVGARAVVLVGTSGDPFDPQAVRASMGTIFSVPVVRVGEAGVFASWARDRSLPIVGTSAHADVAYGELAWPRPVAIAFGNEQRGMSDEFAGAVDRSVRIPMKGRASSLNLAAAVAVLAFSARGQG